MIIVEGTDLVGKTTLCKALEAELNANGSPYVYRHLSRLGTAVPTFAGYLPMLRDRCVIADRLYLSRQAYGRALKNQAVLSDHEQMVLDAVCVASGVQVVIVTATEGWLRDAYAAADRDEMYSLQQILDVNAEYERLLISSLWHVHLHVTQTSCFVNASDKPAFEEGQQYPSDWAPRIRVQYLQQQQEWSAMQTQAAARGITSWSLMQG